MTTLTLTNFSTEPTREDLDEARLALSHLPEMDEVAMCRFMVAFVATAIELCPTLSDRYQARALARARAMYVAFIDRYPS